MLIAIIGESCAGKTTLAERIRDGVGAETVSGKDFLRMAKSPAEAERVFGQRLVAAVNGENLIWVITEREHLKLLPDGAVKILVTADLDTIKERFKARMHGNLPAPVEKMLESKHGVFDEGEYAFRFDGVNGDAARLVEELKKL